MAHLQLEDVVKLTLGNDGTRQATYSGKQTHMTEFVTASPLLEHLSPYDLDRVRFQMADGLPVVAVYIDTDGGRRDDNPQR